MKKLIIAAAGAGKTTYLINEALKIIDGNVLITTFTQSNEREIRKKFFDMVGYIPPNVTIQTWFSFLIQHGVKPYQSYLYENKVTGLLLVEKKSALHYYSKGRPIYYAETDVAHHYFTQDGLIYSDKLSKFVYKLNEANNGITINRIGRAYEYIFIDEVQDLAGYDLELINLLSLEKISLLMIGDPRQVTYHTHEESKNSQYSEGKIEEFIKKRCADILVDTTTLNVTYRNHPSICNFANAIYPSFPPCQAISKPPTGHDGIFFVLEKDVDAYLRTYSPVQLRDSRKKLVNDEYQVMNFGDSKGLTFDRTIIYPTAPMKEWIFDHTKELKAKSRARLYVAITRARYSAAIVIKDVKANVNDVSIWRA